MTKVQNVITKMLLDIIKYMQITVKLYKVVQTSLRITTKCKDLQALKYCKMPEDKWNQIWQYLMKNSKMKFK